MSLRDVRLALKTRGDQSGGCRKKAQLGHTQRLEAIAAKYSGNLTQAQAQAKQDALKDEARKYRDEVADCGS